MRVSYSVLNLFRRANSKGIKVANWALANQFHPYVTPATRRGMQRL
jgi:DnaJ-class molecular chaperone